MPKMNCPSCRKELSIEGKMQMRFCPYCGCGLDWRQAIFNENITNARAFLNAGKYKEAIPCYNKVLSIEPKNIEALLGVVLAECKVTSLESFYLDESTYQIDTTQSYQKLMDNAPAELKNRVYKAVWAAKERAFAPMLEKARVMLLEEKWDYALKIYTVIDTLSPKEVAQGKLLAELKVRCRQELGKSSKQFATNRLYRSLYELSTEKEKRELKGYVAESCEAVLALAREQKNNGDFENALDNCRYILSINPEHQGALYVALLAEANAQTIEEIDKKELLSSKYYTALSALSKGGLKDTLNSVKKSVQKKRHKDKQRK